MLLLTCPFGLSSVLSSELKYHWLTISSTFPTGCWVDSTKRKDIITLNLSSRIANKVYLQLDSWLVKTFDELFALVRSIDWQYYIPEQMPFVVTAFAHQSQLHAVRSIQSISHKAIITQLTGSQNQQRSTTKQPPLEVRIQLIENQAHIMLNTSGDSLHARWRRIHQWAAPIKENLAAATVLLASWPFRQPLRDPCCGAGTIAIEAARLAANILSGKQRRFDFQRFVSYAPDGYETIRRRLISDEITDKSRTIIASDIDTEMLAIARKNAKQAGVDQLITFVEHDILSPSLPAWLTTQQPTTLVANPPYGQRLESPEVDHIHLRLSQLVTKDWRNGAVITGYDQAKKHFPRDLFKLKRTKNGAEEVRIFSKKS